MTGWNLPPGCRESDIPGNRPIDAAWDNWYDRHIDDCWEKFLEKNDDGEETLRNKYKDSKTPGQDAYADHIPFQKYADEEFQRWYDRDEE